MRAQARTRRRTLLAASLSAVLATGCAAGREPDRLTFMDYHGDEPMRSAMSAQLEECGRQIGIGVRHYSVTGDQLVPKALRMASSRSLPDVLMLDNPDLPQFADTSALVPLTDLGVGAEGMAANITGTGRYRGELYGVAPTVNTLALYYNEDILRAAGVRPPRTWDELRRSARELTTAQHRGIGFSAYASFEGAYQFLAFLWPNGGDERRLDSPQVAGALRLWTDLVRSGAAPQSVLNWEQGDVKNQFTAGRLAMMVNGSWQAAEIRETPGLNWGVVPIPVPRPGAPPATALGGEVMTIPKTEPWRQRKAAELVRCMNTEKAQMAVARAANRVPSRPAAAAKLHPQVPDLQVFYDTAPAARARTEHLGTRWPETARALWTAIQSAISGNATPEQALERAQQQANAGA
ncbi:ABC transporter substrate-binding protein [Saccharopolyspora griseoalba]|uniref:ABC transporter substrate-binding protein n=1 Tax=Saccharopolyspora griseoalba TaxID=1431848 RepID=A0ABW2LLS5_9PSEU